MKSPAPVGDYNPDWAIAFTEGAAPPLYFVAETKGSVSTLQLTGVEDVKIACARKFFAEVNTKLKGHVKYDVANSYSKLKELVAG